MNEIFTKYDGEGAETKAVDILQTQVGVMFPCILIAFSSHLCFHSLTPVQLCLHLLLSFPSLVVSILKGFFSLKNNMCKCVLSHSYTYSFFIKSIPSAGSGLMLVLVQSYLSTIYFPSSLSPLL